MRADEPHPDVRTLLDQIAALDALPLAQYGPEGARETFAQMRSDAEGPAVGSVTDREVPGFEDGPDVSVRIYEPDTAGPTPTVLFAHGGGFVIGGLESHDLVCRTVVDEAGVRVVAVDYRLAPEHPFPAAVEDTYAALEWAAATEDLDSDGNLAVMGDSAGGNLAAAASLLARDWDGPDIDYQALVYPTVSPREDWPSRDQNGEGYYLNERDMQWFDDCYFGSRVHAGNPYAVPLVAADHSDLPPATVLTAGFDPLRDEGVAYAEALADAGVPVEHRNHDDMIHGFFSMLADPANLDAAHEAHAALAADLNAAFD
jgi:acetyl esterase